MKTIDDLTFEQEQLLSRQLKLCAKNINKLAAMSREFIGPEANIFLDESPTLNVMDGDACMQGRSNAGAGERQKHVIMSSGLVDMGGGAW